MRVIAELAFITLCLFAFGISQKAQAKDMCFLTDMSSDVDDFGALDLMIKYHIDGKIKLRCVIIGPSNTKSAKVVNDYIRHQWKVYGIPVGQDKSGALTSAKDYRWVDQYIAKYKPKDYTPVDGVALLQQKLSQYPVMDVVEVGPAVLAYRANLIPSEYSLMAGDAETADEHNQHTYIDGMEHVQDHPATFYDSALGSSIKTGQKDEIENNKRLSFAYRTYLQGSYSGRQSWDLLAVVGAVEGPTWFTYERGNFTVISATDMPWTKTSTGKHLRAIAKDKTALKNYINGILAINPNDLDRKEINLAPMLSLLLLDD